MPSDLFGTLIHTLAVGMAWIILIRGVSTAYAVTIERFDHADVWNDRTRILLESHNRRRL